MKLYEDINIGDEFVTQGRTITEADLVFFAALTGDFNPIHIDEEFSKEKSIYKTRVVHGLLLLSLAEGLFYNYGWFQGGNAITIGYNNVEFKAPVFIGDTIRFTGKVKMKRESKSKQGWGIVTIEMEGVNQRNEKFLSFEHTYFVKKR